MPNSSPSLTQEIAAFIADARPANVPAVVLHHAKRSFLDGLGLALAGAVSEGSHLLRDYLLSVAPARTGGCTVIGTSAKLPPRFAALANGYAIHADDYDDTQHAEAPGRVYGLLT
ncbi:MAG: MmgE/PrpD family protein, partial [Burkholderiales bacterium]